MFDIPLKIFESADFFIQEKCMKTTLRSEHRSMKMKLLNQQKPISEKNILLSGAKIWLHFKKQRHPKIRKVNE